ncbi:MAG: ComF family protein [Clostridia bacterium]|nr:ComF family protein [Clostridia bacterium]
MQDYSENIDFNFDEHLYIFSYEGIIRKKILDYKFNEKTYLYKTFSNYIVQNENFCKVIKEYNVIIPVPISKKRLKTRGYNQSFLIAKELSKNLNIKLINNCLYKTQNIIEQSKLNKEERFKNIEGVYKLQNKELIEGKKLLLFDDIFTTGSTVNECSKMLSQANPKKIGILTIAKD